MPGLGKFWEERGGTFCWNTLLGAANSSPLPSSSPDASDGLLPLPPTCGIGEKRIKTPRASPLQHAAELLLLPCVCCAAARRVRPQAATTQHTAGQSPALLDYTLHCRSIFSIADRHLGVQSQLSSSFCLRLLRICKQPALPHLLALAEADVLTALLDNGLRLHIRNEHMPTIASSKHWHTFLPWLTPPNLGLDSLENSGMRMLRICKQQALAHLLALAEATELGAGQPGKQWQPEVRLLLCLRAEELLPLVCQDPATLLNWHRVKVLLQDIGNPEHLEYWCCNSYETLVHP